MQQLFGQKILNDFIQKQDEKLIENRWQKYKNFLAKKDKISSWIETDYQDGFLEDIFENCLGYISKTRSTNEHYTLEREKKNETNAQKADGALLVDDKVVAVIELKDQKTKDLDKKYNREESAVRQAFGYLQHNNHAKYVIVSNFNELRFYFDKATAYEQFFLFDLDYDGFKKLHTILSYESIKEGLPLKLKEKSLIHEHDVSNKLYKDYTAFRTQLFENILKNNPDIDKLVLLNATQKLIDRIVFILFGEDTKLLPEETIGTIIEHQKVVKKLVKNFTLYDSYKAYFEAINTGDEDLDITMYNGGLFAEDELLNKLVIDNEVLDARAKILSGYNFGSDISVNILGHIFENSISELEEISAQLLENEFDKKQSKRKKDGVFYTPAYITEYIVQNTLGKLCEEKREELNIGSETLVSPKNPKNPTKAEQQTKENLLLYKEWLLNLKILDPACGSGAFLNQALEYLLKEHKKLQNDLALMGDLFASYEVEKEVLEHNLYGVDINEGAVEIARLSLWLRTAKRGRPLTKLANKIKVGNSLIDDKTVVPNAFDWHAEFPEVFAQGGFDVVIGNPPWGASIPNNQILHLKDKYPDVTSKSNDSYLFFTLHSLNLLNNQGLLGFIIPNTWMLINTAKDIREKLLQYEILKIIDYGDGVFENVTAESSTIIIKNKLSNSSVKVEKIKNSQQLFEYYVDKINWSSDTYSRVILEKNNEVFKFLSIIKKKTIPFSNIAEIIWGIKPYQVGHGMPIQTREMLENRIYHSDTKIDDSYKPLLVGSNINRYSLYFDDDLFIKYGNNLMYPSNEQKMLNPKLLMRQTSDILRVVYDKNSFYCQNSIFIISSTNMNLKYLQVLLNSNFLNFLYSMDNPQSGKTFAEIKPSVIKDLPIMDISEVQQIPFIQKADKMLELNKNLQETKQNFINELKLEKFTKKLQNFEELTFEEFIAEYTKSLKLKFADKLQERNFKQEWQAIFENDKALACGYKTEITKTDKEIDKMVYELYGLSDEEIKIVEGL